MGHQLRAQHVGHASRARSMRDRAALRQLSLVWEKHMRGGLGGAQQGGLSVKFSIRLRLGFIPSLEGTGPGVGSRDWVEEVSHWVRERGVRGERDLQRQRQRARSRGEKVEMERGREPWEGETETQTWRTTETPRNVGGTHSNRVKEKHNSNDLS